MPDSHFAAAGSTALAVLPVVGEPFHAASLPMAPAARALFAHQLAELEGQELPEPCGWRLLVLQYQRPERSAGGVFIPDVVHREDQFQGRVGLVLAVGAGCWRDRDKYPEGPWAKAGDVVAWPKLDVSGSRIPYDGVPLVFVNDDAVLGRRMNAAKALGA